MSASEPVSAARRQELLQRINERTARIVTDLESFSRPLAPKVIAIIRMLVTECANSLEALRDAPPEGAPAIEQIDLPTATHVGVDRLAPNGETSGLHFCDVCGHLATRVVVNVFNSEPPDAGKQSTQTWRGCDKHPPKLIPPAAQASSGAPAEPTEEQVHDFARTIGELFATLRDAPVWEKLDQELYEAWVEEMQGRAADMLERMPQKQSKPAETPSETPRFMGWQPMETCEDGARVLMLTKHGAIEGYWSKADGTGHAYFWQHIGDFYSRGWMPVPFAEGN